MLLSWRGHQSGYKGIPNLTLSWRRSLTYRRGSASNFALCTHHVELNLFKSCIWWRCNSLRFKSQIYLVERCYHWPNFVMTLLVLLDILGPDIKLILNPSNKKLASPNDLTNRRIPIKNRKLIILSHLPIIHVSHRS